MIGIAGRILPDAPRKWHARAWKEVVYHNTAAHPHCSPSGRHCPTRGPPSMRRLLASSDFRAGFAEMLPACIGPHSVRRGLRRRRRGRGRVVARRARHERHHLLRRGADPRRPVARRRRAARWSSCSPASVLGLRFLMYSAAMAPYLKALPSRWQQALAFLLTDQAFAAAIRRFDAKDDPRGGRAAFPGLAASRCICAGRSPTWSATSPAT